MTLHTGDCLDVMAGMEPELVDAIVTDPPYGLEFMGKEWDRLGGSGEKWSEKRTSSPDWNGRRVDRQATAYPRATKKRCRTCGRQEFSGNPCSCPEPSWEVIASAPRQLRAMQAWHQQWAEAAYRVAKPSAYLLAFGGTRTVHRLTCALEDAGWIIRDMLVWGYASGFPKGKANLKPAWEPIVMARKPGPLRALAIDACRIGFGDERVQTEWPNRTTPNSPHPMGSDAVLREYDASKGRWPANVILTDPIFDGGIEGVVGGGAQSSRGPAVNNRNSEWSFTSYPGSPEGADLIGYGDSGTYSRFFLIPKADRADREPVLGGHGIEPGNRVLNSGSSGRTFRDGEWVETHSEPRKRANVHPTVKPVDLMRHLVRLVTPPGVVVLDPFLGSGTTAIAAEMEGFPWVGIEREESYVAIAEARLNGVQRGLGLETV